MKKLKNLCRMCAAQCDKPIMIYGPEGIENELALKITNYLPIKVSESDSLPVQLCYECTNNLNEWDAVVHGSLATEKKLRALQWQEQKMEKEAEKKFGREASDKRRVPNVEETLCCSICNKSGMDFRQLVQHIKDHHSDCSNNRQLNEDQDKVGFETSDHHLDARIFHPFVHLEPLQMELRSKRKLSEETTVTYNNKSSTETNDKNLGRPRTKNGKQLPLLEEHATSCFTEGRTGEPLVTSSTCTVSSKSPASKNPSATNASPIPPSDSSNISDKDKNSAKEGSILENHDPNGVPKPKVRIISAESINHNLEQRAKANQNSRIMESCSPIPIVTSPSKPSDQPCSFSVPPKGKIIMSMSASKISAEMAARLNIRPNFLKLADGRVVRILQGSNKSFQKIRTYPSMPRGVSQSLVRPITATTASFIASEPRRELQTQNVNSETQTIPLVDCDLDQTEGCQKNEHDPEVLLGTGVPECLPTGDTIKLQTVSKQVLLPSPYRKEVKVSDKVVTFRLQPGPKNSSNRYICVVCNTRNLPHSALCVHAQLHKPDAKPVVQISSLPSSVS